MKKLLTAACLTGALLVGPVGVAHAQDDGTESTSEGDDDSGKLGLIGLAGLLGLAGLARRDRRDDRRDDLRHDDSRSRSTTSAQ